MPKGYTSNQTGAIACLLTSAVWGITAHAVGRMLSLTHPIYTILVIILWVLLPFYVRLKKHAFIVGIFILAVGMSYLALLTKLLGTASWFTFSRGLYDFTYALWYLISIACMYFSYRTYNEIRKPERIKAAYTSNQTGAITCWLAGCMWTLTAHAVSSMLGFVPPSRIYTVFIIVTWILALFYIKLISHAFITGIFLVAIALCYLLITPSILGLLPWYLFKRGLYDFTYVLFYLLVITIIYFSYKSYKELLGRT